MRIADYLKKRVTDGTVTYLKWWYFARNKSISLVAGPHLPGDDDSRGAVSLDEALIVGVMLSLREHLTFKKRNLKHKNIGSLLRTIS